PPGAGDLKVAVSSGLEALLRSEAEAAAERAEASWTANAAGRQLLGRTDRDLGRAAPDFADRAARAIRDWQGAVLDLVADTGMAKRSRARFVALGVNGIGAALMIVVFAQTGGITGAEVGIAGGTTVIAQRVLEAVFGDQAVRRLAMTAKDELDSRVSVLMSDELLRYHRLLDETAGDPEVADRIRSAAAQVQHELSGGVGADRSSGAEAPARTALPGALPALDPPTVRQVPYQVGDDDIVDAELVELEEPEGPTTGGMR
ncbi:MAG TPA: ABC transporter, partial [Microlunatus sp.]|nr:ABC transporter [Microlunatus sp.]